MGDKMRVILEAQTGQDWNLSLDTDIGRCLRLSLHTLDLQVNEELVHGDLCHLRLRGLVSEVFREEFAEGLGRGGIASTKDQAV